MTAQRDVKSTLQDELRQLRLPAFCDGFKEIARRADQEGLSHEQYLLELTDRECNDRRSRRIERMLNDSELPLEKTWSCFDQKRLTTRLSRQFRTLLEGGFVDRRENDLAFGNSGAGKSHLLSALGQELIRQLERRVYDSPCSLLVQDLLVGKRDLKLSDLKLSDLKLSDLKRLSKFDVLIIDDIVYVPQSRDEMEVLFTLLAARYERGSVRLTSNLPFSQRETIFKDPLTTARRSTGWFTIA